MKKELVLVIIGLIVTMIIGINNIYGKAFADPAHCDLSGWPPCYKVGYDDGLGMSGSCPSGHSSEFCRGWDDATSSSNNNASSTALDQNASNQEATQQNVSTTTWKDFGDFSDLANIPLVGGMIASHSVTTGILHNEQGVFIPWSVICTQGSQYLLKPCSSLVNPDGSLTSQGDTAVGCIRNGFAAATVATKYTLPFNLTKGILSGAAGLTGCGGIVDMSQIQNSDMLQYLLKTAASVLK
jgi:hypothetical protein